MATDGTRLRLFQLVSPALPVGGFSYSEGVEVLVQRGVLADGAAVQAWLLAELERGAVAVETAALRSFQLSFAAADGEAVVELDGWLLAQREAAELRVQQRQMGQSLTDLLAHLGWPLQPTAPVLAWPAAFAWAAHCLELASPAVEEAYLYSWVANQLSAAVRLVPLGPTRAQQLQLQLAGPIAERAATLAATDPHSLWSGGVGAGLAQLQHAELYSRLFRS